MYITFVNTTSDMTNLVFLNIYVYMFINVTLIVQLFKNIGNELIILMITSYYS